MPVWGIFDTKDGLWLGNDAGPKLFSESLNGVDARTLAQVSCQMTEVQIGFETGRLRPRLFVDGPLQEVDEVHAKMTPARALRLVERGA